MPDTDTLSSPLEAFVRVYLDTVGGVWDEVEPQVYDVLLPGATTAGEGGMARITFDPEALPEHPAAQLASLGTPFIDRLLADALQRGRQAHYFMVGLNLAAHDLPGRFARVLTLPPPLELVIEHVRAMHFAQAILWFQAEFVSDQREQEIIPVAMDLHYGREVRHLDKLLERGRLASEPAQPLPDARRLSVARAHALARDQVLRTVAALAHGRSRELASRLDRQVSRLKQYYTDLRSELEAHARRSRDKDDGAARLSERRAALDREEEVRIAEMRQKSMLRVDLRLLQVLLIQQPKLLLKCVVTTPDRSVGPLELVWDPLTETPEAPACPSCRRPSYALERSRLGHLVCTACPPEEATSGRAKGRHR
jgi:hypothetical protein